MSTPYLVGHYIKNLWASPNQENQYLVRPSRVTPFNGARNYVSIFKEQYTLPTKHDRYHAYVVGQIPEKTINLAAFEWWDRSDWIKLSDYCKETKMWFQFYTKNGIAVPLEHIYFTLTLEKNLVFVIKEDVKIPWDMNEEPITFRTYRNLVVTQHHDREQRETLDHIYLKVQRASQRTVLNQFYQKYSKQTGKIFTFVNGFLVKDPITETILEGDVVEVIYDSTITKMIELKLKDLPTFVSKLDGIRKHLFTHDKSYPKNLFEYFDDCDFYITGHPNTTPKLFKGVVLHRNDISNIRQVTNCDFAISTNLTKEMMHYHTNILNQQNANVTIQVYYRKPIEERKFPFVQQRLHELNKLSFPVRTAALRGLRSNLSFWRAENLEASDLMRAMSMDVPTCDLTTIQNVYGYNGATWYTAKSVHPYQDFKDTGTGGKTVDVPYSFREVTTVFEYDEEGRLHYWKRMEGVNQYQVVGRNTRYVEFISGVGTKKPLHYYGTFQNVNFEIPVEAHEFRIYAYPVELDNLTYDYNRKMNTWEDITDKVNVEYSFIHDRKFMRIKEKRTSPTDPRPMYNLNDKIVIYRHDREFLCRNYQINISKDNLSFSLMQVYTRHDYTTPDIYVSNQGTENLMEMPLKIPYAYLDVFLNGRALIEGVDYFVDFPKVHIINKGCINQQSVKQDITFRMYGFPDTTIVNNQKVLTGIVNVNRQVGYVNNSMLSRNGRWDILDDKNLLIKVGNGIIAKEDLGFTEDGSVIPRRTSYLEGKPYEITDIISAKRDAYPRDGYQFKQEAEEIDKQVSDYMSQFFPEPRFTSNPPINGLYKIFSPLLSRLIWDLKNNQINFPTMTLRYTDTEVIQYIERNYSNFFKIEPYFRLDNISLKHVTIHPTYKDGITTLSYHAVRWLRTVIRIYFNNQIEVSHFIRIED